MSLFQTLLKKESAVRVFSFCRLFKRKYFYLKTVNQGKVYIRRNNKLALLIERDETASGYIKEEDVFVFTFNRFMKLLGEETD